MCIKNGETEITISRKEQYMTKELLIKMLKYGYYETSPTVELLQDSSGALTFTLNNAISAHSEVLGRAVVPKRCLNLDFTEILLERLEEVRDYLVELSFSEDMPDRIIGNIYLEMHQLHK
ncbi:hypothetical protein DRQ25_15230 [Candidatus Fermentibacteria bacterium]|nr:MAG: hypothetical protein DRQ25_15230 [Candidatus Fermentibacteria bacterium]